MDSTITATGDNRRRWAQVLIHCAVVLLVFVMPDLLITYLKPQKPGTFYLSVYGRTVCILIIFYANYLWLIPRTLSRKPRRVWLYVGANLLLTAAFLGLMYLLMSHMPHHHHRPPRDPVSATHLRSLVKMLPMLVRDFITVVLAVGLSITLKLTEAWAALERKNEEIMAAQRTEEIQNLRSQLNPHSIFNTLNTIYALIDIDTEKAKEAVHRLSKLLRYMLYENPSTVALEKEAEFMRSYVALMEMRLGPGSVRLDIGTLPGAEIAPLLFLPVIENAFKHSSGASPEAPVEIAITREGDSIVCRTRNPYAEPAPGSRHGIGLENLRRRLRLLYGDSASLATEASGGLFTATVTVPLHD